MAKSNKSKKTTPMSLRFDTADFEILKKMAEREGMDVSKFIRACAINHAKNILAQEDLAKELSAQEPPVAPQTIFDKLDGIKDVISKSVETNYDLLRAELDFIKRRIERVAYTTHYHTLPVPPEGKDAAAESAHQRTQILFSEIHNDEAKINES